MDVYADDEDVVTFWVAPHDDVSIGGDFLVAAGVDTTCLLDDMSNVYNSYAPSETGMVWAPFPMQVVIDRDGIITYLANEADPAAVIEAIEAAR